MALKRKSKWSTGYCYRLAKMIYEDSEKKIRMKASGEWLRAATKAG